MAPSGISSSFTSAVGSAVRRAPEASVPRARHRAMLNLFIMRSFHVVRAHNSIQILHSEIDERRRIKLSKFDGSKSQCGQHGGDEPEADDDLRLRPAFALEMMMQRGHEEDSSAFAEFSFCVFEVTHLQK